MKISEEQLDEILYDFKIDTDGLKEVAADFRYDLRKGLKDPEESSLQMLNAYISLPTGKETGEFLALDFGGTNVRGLKIRLEGKGKFTILKKVEKKLKTEEYSYISKDSTAEGLFGLLAEVLDNVVEGDKKQKFLLGHTFSFSTKQTNIYNARLISWAKEFATPGVEGEVVNDLLKKALLSRGFQNIEPVAVINDTVATLLSANYKREGTYIASIYATGHNTCYQEPYRDTGEKPRIINLESGGFSRIFPNPYDSILDGRSEKPGSQRFEKMVSGRYMGELLGVVLEDVFKERPHKEFTAVDISAIISDDDDFVRTKEVIKEKLGFVPEKDDITAVRKITGAIAKRSARLVAASLVGIIWQLDMGKTKQHIAIDGSVYEKMPGVKESMEQAFNELLEDQAPYVDIFLDKDGSGLGAAIAAAIAKNEGEDFGI